MTGKKLGEASKEILFEVCIGILLYSIVGLFVILIIPVPKIQCILGFLLGTLISALSMVHITYSSEYVLDMHNPREAQKYITQRYFFRMAIIAAFMLLIYFTDYLDVVAFFVGLFAIKIGAYLQPLTHKKLKKYVKRQ